MSEKKKPLKSPADNIEELGLKNAASSMDCTGLMPTLPENADAEEAYREIFDFGPQNPDVREIYEK